jgi:hypothetical protein
MYIPLNYSTILICPSSIYYCIININIHQCIINNNKHIHTMQNTLIFTWKPNAGEKNRKIYYMSTITFKEAQTSDSPATTGRRLQAPSFSGSNLKEAPTPQVLRLQPEGRSNSLILQKQTEGGYNPLSLPHHATLKYKFQITDETTATMSL